MSFVLWLSTAFAESTPIGQVTTAITYNRLALSANGQYGLHVPKWEKEDNILFQNTGIDVVGELSATPAFSRLGMRATITPIALLKLQGYAFASYYFGNFQTIVGYDTLDENYGENSEVNAYADASGRQYAAPGWNAGGKATLQAKAGSIIFSNTIDYGMWSVNAPENETGEGFFEREKELMMAFGSETAVENNTLLLYQIDKSDDVFYRIGNLTTYRHSIIADDTLIRSGLLFVAQPKENRNHVVIVQPYLQDRAFTSLTKPYVAYAYKVLM
jgi:hypothetical protein